MLTSLALIFILGLTLGGLCKRLKLPALLGMLLSGILLGPQVFNLLDSSILNISADLRQLALIIILARAGLSLDLNSLRSTGRATILLCFVPATFEILAFAFLTPLFFDVTILEGAVIGSVIAAVSPAVIVPRMISLIERKMGTEKGIPQMVLASASVDDVFVIVMLTVTTGLVSNGGFSAISLLTVPVSVVLGLISGVICGIIISLIFKSLHMRDSAKVLIVLSTGFLLVELENILKLINVPLSAMLGVMAMGVTIFKLQSKRATRISEKFGRLWVGAELLLFTLVGAIVDLSYVAKAGFMAVILLILALLVRIVGVIVSTAGTTLTAKERLFTAIAFCPKATVQAAVGGVPLAMGLSCGNLALTLAVLAIVITAPTGAFAIDKTASYLLATGK